MTPDHVLQKVFDLNRAHEVELSPLIEAALSNLVAASFFTRAIETDGYASNRTIGLDRWATQRPGTGWLSSWERLGGTL